MGSHLSKINNSSRVGEVNEVTATSPGNIFLLPSPNISRDCKKRTKPLMKNKFNFKF